jgi:hypothetical protein
VPTRRRVEHKLTRIVGSNNSNASVPKTGMKQRLVKSSCGAGKYINFWLVRVTGSSAVNTVQGRCNDGKWLERCGKAPRIHTWEQGWIDGGSVLKGEGNPQFVPVRTSDRVDMFNNRGSNGGTPHTLDCGTGFRITGYNALCSGSQVDRIQLQCTSI